MKNANNPNSRIRTNSPNVVVHAAPELPQVTGVDLLLRVRSRLEELMAARQVPPTKMNVYTCQYVKASELFMGLKDLLDSFAQSEPPYTWGDTDHTMIFPKELFEWLYGMDQTADEATQMEILRQRIWGLPMGVYVDLET